MLHNVFISYSRQDLAAVDRLATDLERAGIPIWVDRRDIPVSIPWFDEVRAAIEAADLVVACQTPAWHGSEACQLELEVANANFKRVLALDFSTTPAPEVLDTIVQAYRGASAAERTHTEVTARAAMWSLDGRAKRPLLRGSLLGQARALLRKGFPPVTETVGQYIRSSLRRRTVVRTTFWFSSLVVILALCAGSIGLLLPSVTTDQLAESDAVFDSLAASDDPESQDPYEELSRAKSRVDKGKYGWLHRTALVKAMSVNFPETSYRYDMAPAAFTGRFSGPDAEVLDAEGKAYLGGQKPGSPAKPAVAVSYPDRLPPGCCTGAAMAGDTTLLGTEDGALLRWKRPGSPTVAWHSGSTLPVADVAVSADATRAAVALRDDGWIRVLALPGFTLVRSLLVAGGTHALAFSHDGRFLAVGSGVDVAIFDLRIGIAIEALRGSLGTVERVAWSPADDRVWAITSQRRVSGWLWRTGTVVVSGHPEAFMAASGPSRSGLVAAVDRSGQVVVVDPVRAAQAARFQLPVREVVTASISRERDLLAVGGKDKAVVVDLASPERPLVIEVGKCFIMDVALNRGGDRLYVSCLDDGVQAYDTTTGQRVAFGKINYRQTVGLAVTDGTVFVSDNVGEVHAFGTDLRSSTRLVEGHCGEPVYRLSASGDGTTVVMAGDAIGHLSCMYEAHLIKGKWERYFDQLPLSFAERAKAVTMMPDGRRAAIGLSDGSIRFWEPGSLDPQGVYHQFGGEVRGLAYSLDGSKLVAISTEGLVTVLPGCPLCRSVPELSLDAAAILRKAAERGLYQ